MIRAMIQTGIFCGRGTEALGFTPSQNSPTDKLDAKKTRAAIVLDMQGRVGRPSELDQNTHTAMKLGLLGHLAG